MTHYENFLVLWFELFHIFQWQFIFNIIGYKSGIRSWWGNIRMTIA